MLSLELFVVNKGHPTFLRFFAWVKLLKVWASLRSDDTLGVRPELVKMSKSGIEGLLDRTKVSGPGRR
eukprot:9751452-Lingulodinium_polyedra.AAC.1